MWMLVCVCVSVKSPTISMTRSNGIVPDEFDFIRLDRHTNAHSIVNGGHFYLYVIKII